MIRWEVIYYLALFVFVLVMLLNGQSFLLVAGIVLVSTLILFSVCFLYPMVWEKRMDRVERFLRRNQHNPGIYINYVFANRRDDEAEVMMDKLKSKSMKKTTVAIYDAAYGLYHKNMLAIRQAVPEMRRSDHRTYYETILLFEEGTCEQAREHLKSIKKKWMRYALLAEIERKLGNQDLAMQHAKEAVNSSSGVERYILIKEYEIQQTLNES